ncbi:MAG: NAD-dependent epimerase/dehydratase family protein [Candidatus Solibacter sp.]
MTPAEEVLITGASGFLGRACCAAFTAAGYRVRALVRNPAKSADLAPVAQGGIFRGDLPDGIDTAALAGPLRALLHCAYETRSATPAEARRTNVGGTGNLVRLARANEVRQLVFVSSMAAHESAASVYGKTKFELEKLFTQPGDAIVKPATIVGPGGVFQRTREMLRRLPVLPLFYGDRRLQTIWLDDTCQALLTIVQRGISGTILLAHPDATPMRDFYAAIAALDGVRLKTLPFPGDLALFGIGMLEKIGLKPPITTDNLLGIKHLRAFDPRADLNRLDLHPLTFEESLAKLK